MADHCESVEPLLSAWADGELGPPRSHAIERHLAACRDCAIVVEDLAAVRRMVGNLPERRVAGDLVRGVPLRALARPAPPRRVKAFAVAAGLLLGAGLGLGGGAEPDPLPAPRPSDVFMVDFPDGRLARTFPLPVATPALLESGP